MGWPTDKLLTVKLSTHEAHCLLGALAAANTLEAAQVTEHDIGGTILKEMQSVAVRRTWIAERILNALCEVQPELRDSLASIYLADRESRGELK